MVGEEVLQALAEGVSWTKAEAAEAGDVGEVPRYPRGLAGLGDDLDLAGQAGDAQELGEHEVDGRLASAGHVVGTAALAFAREKKKRGRDVAHVDEVARRLQGADADCLGAR